MAAGGSPLQAREGLRAGLALRVAEPQQPLQEASRVPWAHWGCPPQRDSQAARSLPWPGATLGWGLGDRGGHCPPGPCWEPRTHLCPPRNQDDAPVASVPHAGRVPVPGAGPVTGAQCRAAGTPRAPFVRREAEAGARETARSSGATPSAELPLALHRVGAASCATPDPLESAPHSETPKATAPQGTEAQCGGSVPGPHRAAGGRLLGGQEGWY